MRAALAPAKLNLSLRVFSPDPDGYHPLDSIVVAVDWYDQIRMARSEADRLSVDGEDAPPNEDNLVWKAIRFLRDATGNRSSLTIELSKRIPAGAGLGGGSSDAAAAAVAAVDLLDLEMPESGSLFAVGADVPFFITGGMAHMTGRGEHVEAFSGIPSFAVGIVVPPIELATPAVYGRWDALGEPEGPRMPAQGLPPQLRELGPFQNDLWPAALDLSPELGDWQEELAGAWGTAVAMTGSGSGLFGFFPALDEAEDAVRSIDLEFRARRAAIPLAHGAILDPRYTPERH